MLVQWLPPIFSTLFRLAAYVFLAIIPTRLGVPALPVLYVSYLVSLAVGAPPKPRAEANGDAKGKTVEPQVCITS